MQGEINMATKKEETKELSYMEVKFAGMPILTFKKPVRSAEKPVVNKGMDKNPAE